MNTFNQKLKQICIEKQNRLCIGLDIDNKKLENPSLDYMEGFIADIIEATIDLCPIYKINFAFYEKHGSHGYAILKNIPKLIKNRAITIADAKRGDIGNSSRYYADSVFEYLGYDSITVNPYMGEDSVKPFLEYKDNGTFILCLTSNKGSANFQKLKFKDTELYKLVATKSYELNENDNIGLVIGATNSSYLPEIKKISKSMPWLMPGIGFQGGSLSDSIKIEGLEGLSIINVSRDIIYSGEGKIKDIRDASIYYTNKIRENL